MTMVGKIIASILIQYASASLTMEKILHEDLLKEYIKDVRPHDTAGHPLTVVFDMVLQSITELDIRTQTLVVNTFTTMKWNDPQLSWNTSAYAEINRIVISSNLIWTPDVVLYNTADDRPYVHTELYRTKIKVTNEGNVTWTAPTEWKVSCAVEIAWFPFDDQTCELHFGSWTHEKSSLELKMNPLLKDSKHVLGGRYMVGSGVWQITHLAIKEDNSEFRCCDEPFSTIKMDFHLQRFSRFYVVYMLLPLYALILAFALIFHLDISSRASYGLTIILCMTVYLLVISEKLPEKSDEYPFIGVTFIIDFCILCAFLPVAEWTAHLPNRSTARPPMWLVKFMNLCCKSYRPKKMERSMNRMTNLMHSKLVGGTFSNPNMDHSNDQSPKSDDEEEISFSFEWMNIGRFLDGLCTLVYFFIQLVFLIIYLVMGYTTSKGSKG